MLKRHIEYIMVLAIFIIVAFAAAENYTVDLSPAGYMTNDSGMTLYYFINDAPGNGISNCVGDCPLLWPPFYADIIRVPSNLSTSDFATISRTDGELQTTYKGWPLYKYIEDEKPGDTNGDKINFTWFIIYPSKFPPI